MCGRSVSQTQITRPFPDPCPAPEGAGLEASLQPRGSPQAKQERMEPAGGNVRQIGLSCTLKKKRVQGVPATLLRRSRFARMAIGVSVLSLKGVIRRTKCFSGTQKHTKAHHMVTGGRGAFKIPIRCPNPNHHLAHIRLLWRLMLAAQA